MQGLATATELVDAQLLVAVVDAERALAAFNYVQALAELLALAGRPEEFSQWQAQGMPLAALATEETD